MVNLTQCGETFLEGLKSGNATIQGYQYFGPVTGIYNDGVNLPAFISYFGCQELCGKGSDFYEPSDIAGTVSTWILPIVGLLLQAPFESDANWETVLVLFHWIGNPISSLSAIFWNIKACNRCALMVDMAIPYNQKPSREPTGPYSQYSDIRDAFCLLSVMNQYTIDRRLPRRVFEKLLRITLFSNTLMLTEGGTVNDLVERRKKLADKARVTRKRGVVPVFITFMWFLMSFAISLVQAFALLGFNSQAHNLALGLLISWIPIFVLSSIVDRNPTQPEYLCNKINKLIEEVRIALLNDNIRSMYLQSSGRDETTFDWMTQLRRGRFHEPNFRYFTRYAGQGRVRWHYGISHDVLQGVEEGYISEKGRNWMEDIGRARNSLIMGPDQIPETFTRKFDPNSLWQIFASFVIVSCSVFGAFVISYLTPTRGLGCRSLGYLIFWVICMSNLSLELVFWNFIPREGTWDARTLASVASYVLSVMKNGWFAKLHDKWSRKISKAQEAWAWSQRDILEKVILRPLEALNTIFLAGIILAQAVGGYRSCICSCAIFAPGGGYMDFQSQQQYLDRGIAINWASGMALTGLSTTIAFAYIVHEWCTQSHLSTISYDHAAEGLMRTRQWQYFLSIFKNRLYKIEDSLNEVMRRIFGRQEPRSVVLRWSRDCKEIVAPVDYGTESTIGIQAGQTSQDTTERDITSRSSSVYYGTQQDVAVQLESFSFRQRRPNIGDQGPLYDSPVPTRTSTMDSVVIVQEFAAQYPDSTMENENQSAGNNTLERVRSSTTLLP